VRAAQLWDSEQKKWIALDRLSLDFSTDQIGIHGDYLCAINPLAQRGHHPGSHQRCPEHQRSHRSGDRQSLAVRGSADQASAV
jgi:hypothetical protein